MQLEARNQTPVLCLPSGIRWCRSRAGFWRAMRCHGDVQSACVADGPESHPCLPGRRCLGDSQAPALPYRAGTGHPHAGGEILKTPPSRRSESGPSPRGWGNLPQNPECCPALRAIPTRVGKSHMNPDRMLRVAGHPHAGGEIARRSNNPTLQAGPSPRGWGNQRPRLLVADVVRAIPTRVGKSSIARRSALAKTGHPHAGGEIGCWSDLHGTGAGPSPRGWGNLRLWVRNCVAQAGHPHAGGEISRCRPPRSATAGPSPRGWGNRGHQGGQRPDRRAIPTRVGKSSSCSGLASDNTGHPHAGGEIKGGGIMAAFDAGPSPRGWGNRRSPKESRQTSRAIPTRVGKSYLPARGA